MVAQNNQIVIQLFFLVVLRLEDLISSSKKFSMKCLTELSWLMSIGF